MTSGARLLAQPLVVVDAGPAVVLGGDGAALGDGWLHGGEPTPYVVTVARHLDLNADLGEEVTDDDALLAVVTSANVACGYHAGNDEIMRAVCARAAELGVSVGAQVSYDDRAHFGRVARDVASDVLREQVADQVGVLSAHAAAAGTSVRYLKPHGALYHRVIDDPDQAAAVLAGSGSLPVLGMPGELLRLAAASGRVVLHEGFPDRGYADDGRLLPRDRPGALLEDAGGDHRAGAPAGCGDGPVGRLALPARRQPGRGRARARRTPGARGCRLGAPRPLSSSTTSGFHMWRNPRSCGLRGLSCGAICGTPGM